MPKTKNFKLPAEKIELLIEETGGCFATDKILVEGRKVGLMYREPPDFEDDTGWRFLAGDESQKYLDNPDNIGIYDLNTVANYDPDIIPFLDAPVGCALERDNATGEFVEVDMEEDEDE